MATEQNNPKNDPSEPEEQLLPIKAGNEIRACIHKDSYS